MVYPGGCISSVDSSAASILLLQGSNPKYTICFLHKLIETVICHNENLK